MNFCIKVVPNSSRTEIIGWMSDGALKIKIAAPPVDGKANLELISFLAKTLKLPKSDIDITNGLTGKKKTIHLPMSQEMLVQYLSVELGIDEPLVQPKML
ncbi:MAG: DUF167 domain-containing protein [Candidatus Uhrbacteria bacterium]